MFAATNKKSMTIAVLANEAMKQEWLLKPAGNASIIWVRDLEELAGMQADAYFDLLFEQDKESIRRLAGKTAPVFISAVIEPLIDSEHNAADIEEAQVIRINGWPGSCKMN